MHTKVIELKEYSNKEVGLLVQAVLVEVLIIFAIISILVKEFLNPFYIILSLIMFTMAYNNKKIFKRKYMTQICRILGIFIFITTLMEYAF